MKSKVWAIYYYHDLGIFSFVREVKIEGQRSRCPSHDHTATPRRWNLVADTLVHFDAKGRLGTHMGDVTIIVKDNL